MNAHVAGAAVTPSSSASVPAWAPPTVPANVTPPASNRRSPPADVVSVASVCVEGRWNRSSPDATASAPAFSTTSPPLVNAVTVPAPDFVTVPVASLTNVPAPLDPSTSPSPETVHDAAFSTRPPL